MMSIEPFFRDAFMPATFQLAKMSGERLIFLAVDMKKSRLVLELTLQAEDNQESVSVEYSQVR